MRRLYLFFLLALIAVNLIGTSPATFAAGADRDCPWLFGNLEKNLRIPNLDPADRMALEIVFQKIYDRPREPLSLVERSYVEQYGLQQPVETVRKLGRDLETSKTLRRRLLNGTMLTGAGILTSVVGPYMKTKIEQAVAVESYLNNRYSLSLKENQTTDLRFLEQIIECSTKKKGKVFSDPVVSQTTAKGAVLALLIEDKLSPQSAAETYEALFDIWKQTGARFCVPPLKTAGIGVGTPETRKRFRAATILSLRGSIKELTPLYVRDLGIRQIQYGAPVSKLETKVKESSASDDAATMNWQEFRFEPNIGLEAPKTLARVLRLSRLQIPKLPERTVYRIKDGTLSLPVDSEKSRWASDEEWNVAQGLAQAMLSTQTALRVLPGLLVVDWNMRLWDPPDLKPDRWTPSRAAEQHPVSYYHDLGACYLVPSCRAEFERKQPGLLKEFEHIVTTDRNNPNNKAIRTILEQR